LASEIPDPTAGQRADLAAHFRRRVPAIVEAWRAEVAADPRFTAGDSLPRAQLVDHLPVWLENLADAFAAAPGSARERRAHGDESGNAAAHGLQRWQQGYDLQEVTREWGVLHGCLVDELERYLESAAPAPEVQVTARKALAASIAEATTESAAQYFRLERTEAASSLADLEAAIRDLGQLERRRAELWQEAAHDLRGNLGVVSNVAHGLAFSNLPAERRADFLGLLRNNIMALQRLLDDVTDLARLHAGRETRRVDPYDAAETLRGLADDLRPIALDKKLALTASGPATLAVEGDAVKVRRIAQNLLLNALKYTESGSVDITWGDVAGDPGRWVLEVADTGPGFHNGPGAALVGALGETPGETPHEPDPQSVQQAHGEGLGLAIVKRLCELLDASISLTSEPGRGTTVRVLLPRRYAATAPPSA
jgi:signal transduction histidine kinase